MKLRKIMLVLGGVVAMFLTGCYSMQEPCGIEINRSNEKITLDGIDNERVWLDAKVYQLRLPNERSKCFNNKPLYAGKVKLAYDDTNLYMFADFEDDDIVQYAKENFGHFYSSGDLVELFLMSEDSKRYFEIYGTPNGLYSLMFFPNAGRRIFPQALDSTAKLSIGSKMFGSLNNWKDRDKGYTVELAVPIAEINKYGDKFPQGNWSIMIARYNYSVNLDEGYELTTTSNLSKPNFHLRDEYLPVKVK